jgi:CheY-like chemotaxis protein
MNRTIRQDTRAAALVLIVDADARARKRMQAVLEAVGYRTRSAAGAFEALREFGDGEGVDLALVDQQLPEMAGLTVVARLRERDPAACLVLMADGATVRLASEAIAAGASGFLVKDAGAAVLCQAVRGYLAAPRAPVSTLDLPLEQLLPGPGAAPHVRVRTLNGFTFWRVPPEDAEARAGWTGRVYGVRAPWGERCRCEVEVTPAMEAAVAAETGGEVPAADPLWDTLCQLALSNHLGRGVALPPPTLPVRSITGDQLLVLRRTATPHGR